MWKRAVWIEGDREEEGVVPSNWIIGENLHWPKSNAPKLHHERAQPGKNWKTFPLIKTKFTSGMFIFFCKVHLYKKTLPNLKLHNCFAYFNQKINPWRIVFYFLILLLRLLSY